MSDTLKDAENFPLDEATIEILAEVNKTLPKVAEQLDALKQQDARLRGQAEGALILFLRQHKLEGNWQVAPNGRELVKQAANEVRT
jgi:hypothetical protein